MLIGAVGSASRILDVQMMARSARYPVVASTAATSALVPLVAYPACILEIGPSFAG